MAGNSGDFEAIYAEHVWDVYGFVGYRVGSREEAEDLTQLTFERALRAWASFDPARAPARTWLLAIARNLVIDHHRRAGGRESVAVEAAAAERAELFAVDADDPAGGDPELHVALGRLSDRDREIIALRFGGDLTGAEIAELTGLNTANVQQILSRSLRRLRELLDPANGSGGEGADPG